MESLTVSEKEYHRCHFCGEYVDQIGFQHDGQRHYLSDCRSDLVEHEMGETCTWAFRREPLIIGKGTPGERIEEALPENKTCYAYQDVFSLQWTDEHKHFFPDGPM